MSKTEERWITWVEPFSVTEQSVAVYCKVPESTAKSRMKANAKRNGYEYADDEDALLDFMAVHWAWFSEPERDCADKI